MVVGFTKIGPMLGCGLCRPLIQAKLAASGLPYTYKTSPRRCWDPTQYRKQRENFQLLENRVDRLVSKHLRSQRR